MKYKIAMIDQDRQTLERMKQHLELKGYPVDTFTDCLEALQAIRVGHHKIVIADTDMPRLDGPTLMKRLGQLNPLIQVILTTTVATPEKVAAAKAGGARGFLIKPFDSFQVVEKQVDQAVESFEMHLNRTRS